MPKVLRSYNTNYVIACKPGGEITLDTGNNTGKVVVTGDLEVRGETTTVNTTDLAIEDNIIVLNKGEDGEGVGEGTSGIEIDRGDFPNARWVFDESVQWALGGLNGIGTFYAERDGDKLPLNTPGIVSPGDLYVDTGSGVITVTGTLNYEESVFNYEAGVISPAADGSIIKDDDHIPNAKGIADFIAYSFENNLQPSIQEGNTKLEAIDDIHTISEIIALNPVGTSSTVLATSNPHGFNQTDVLTITGVNGNGDPIENLNGTNIEIVEIINQFSFRIESSIIGGDITAYVPNSGTVSKINAEQTRVQFTVGGTEVSEFFEDRTRIEGIEFSSNEISASNDGENLILKSPGLGNVEVDDVLKLTAFPWAGDSALPVPPADGVRIYTTQDKTTGTFSDQTLGKSGIFFVNSNRTQDELISRNRSLLYSMLF